MLIQNVTILRDGPLKWKVSFAEVLRVTPTLIRLVIKEVTTQICLCRRTCKTLEDKHLQVMEREKFNPPDWLTLGF